jgi:hypothetical protein
MTQHPIHCRAKLIIQRDSARRTEQMNKRTHSQKPIPVAALSTAWVCGRSLAGIAGSNPGGGVDVCL